MLLVSLAYVQYWQFAELRQAERRQLDISLRATADRFAEDFTSELLRVATAFRLEQESDADPLTGQLADSFEQWLGSAEYPQLIRDVLVIRPADNGGDGVASLFHYGGSGPGLLTPIDWPERLEPVWFQLGDESPPPPDGQASTRQQAIFLEAGPALAIPFVPLKGTFPAWLVVELNDDLITKELLPSLFDSYFGAEESPYRFGIVSAQVPRKVVYGPGAFTVDDAESADVIVDLPLREDGTEPRAARLQSMRIVVTGEPRWRLAVKHKLGSLDAAVDSLRRQNLVVAAAVLLVLASSGVLVIVSAGRARRNARMQMELAASMSHELRTPLAVIRAAAYNLKEGVVADRDGVQRYGTLVQDAGRRLSKVVDQFLMFAETQSDSGKIELTPVHVGEVVDRAIEAVCAGLPDSRNHVRKEIPDGLPEAIADPEALSHCIQNLVVNGIKYGASAEDRPVRITAAVGAGAREMEVHVSDCGPGIQKQHLRHIFKPFYRASAKPGGAGVGLALVGRLMESQGGRVSVRTAPNEGTTFVLHLPLVS
jgi:signal transduction histidine kinase